MSTTMERPRGAAQEAPRPQPGRALRRSADWARRA
ncbi:MAG: hypothetical protein JWO98_2288, partial [Frankiales bacterium]|nr:hypothetical protein [Frankiales bacterium]